MLTIPVGAAFAVCVFALGAAIGSFLNVVIYRVPVGLSVVRPASRCPSCETTIKAWHNIPVLGYLLVRGKCASCGVKLSIRYPLVELAVGLLSLALFHDLAGGLLTPEALVAEGFFADVLGPFVLYLVFLAGLVAITFIDLDWFVIPNAISLPAIPLGIAASAVAGHAIGVTWQDSALGAALGAGVLLAVIFGYAWATGREGMGGGDWKLLGAIGAWLGWQALVPVLLASSLQGLALAVLFRRGFAVEELPPLPDEAPPAPAEDQAGEGKSFRHLAVPFGPFLALAAVEYLLFREEVHWLLTRWLALSG